MFLSRLINSLFNKSAIFGVPLAKGYLQMTFMFALDELNKCLYRDIGYQTMNSGRNIVKVKNNNNNNTHKQTKREIELEEH